MSGDLRTGQQAGTDQQRLRRTDARGQRLRRRLVEQLGQAATPEQRITAAAQYLRGRMARTSPEVAESTASTAVEWLIALADGIPQVRGQRRRSRSERGVERKVRR